MKLKLFLAGAVIILTPLNALSDDQGEGPGTSDLGFLMWTFNEVVQILLNVSLGVFLFRGDREQPA